MPNLRFALPALALVLVTACTAAPTNTPVSPTEPAPTSAPTSAPTLAPGEPSPTPEPTRPAPTGTVTFAIDPARSSVSYSVDETFINDNNRLGTAVGRTSQIQGQLNLNFDAPAQSEFGEFTVDLSTLRSDSRRRDEAIQRQWLESATYPLATFVVRGVENFPADPQEGQTLQFQLAGDLTVRTGTQAVTWDVTATLANDVLSGQATARILMADFGIEPPSIAGILSVTDGVTLRLDFVMLPAQ